MDFNEQKEKHQPDRLPVEDNIFVIEPEPKKPVDKKSIWLTVTLTIIGIVILIVVFIMAVVGSADGLASNYRSLALVQVKKLDEPLKNLEPSMVLNNRNLDKSLGKIYLSQQSQPSLENVLFVANWSGGYARTEKLKTKLKTYYEKLDAYSTALSQMLAFDDKQTSIAQQESALVARANPSDSLSLRAVGGSYNDLAKEIAGLMTPPQLKNLQKDIVKIYDDKAAIYLKWATAIEAGDASTTAVLQGELATLDSSLATAVTDKNYTKLLTPSYKELLDLQQSLKTALAN